MLFALAGVVFGQTSAAPTELPPRGDDYLYAKALLRTGFPRLAIQLLEREESRPGQTPLKRREIGEQIVAAYQQLAGRSAGADERARYLELARRKIETMAKDLGESAVTPALSYQRAKVLQDEGRSIARQTTQERDAERKKALIEEGVRKFDECSAILERTAADIKKQIDAAMQKSPATYQDETREIRVVMVQSELQRCWTAYYKAFLYGEGSADFNTHMAQAVQLFGAFVEKYPNDMGMLIARYGRGLSYKLLKKYEEAKKDFEGVVQAIDTEEEARAQKIPEVHPIKARCRINWAEVSGELGEYDPALVGLAKMFETNEVLKQDMGIRDLAMVTKADVLAGKAASVKAADRDEARKLYKEAIETLGEVIDRSGPMSYEAKEKVARYVREGDLAVLTPEARMAYIESLLREKKYAEAEPELRKLINNPNVKEVPPKLRFKAHRMLAVALRYAGEYAKSIVEFENILRTHRREIGTTVTHEEMAKIGLELVWTLSVAYEKNPGDLPLRKRYREALKSLGDDYPDTAEGLDARFYYAEALREEARTADAFVDAADAYARVLPASRYAGRAYYLRGLCCYNAFKQYASVGQRDDAKAREVLKKASEILEDAIAKGLEAPEGESWLIEAAGVLADLHLEAGENDKALAVLQKVAAKFPAASTSDPKMLSTWVSVYLRTGQLEKALAALDELDAKKKDVKVQDVFNSTLEVSDGYFKGCEKLRREAAEALAAAVEIKPDDGAAELARKTRLEQDARTKLDEAAKLGKITSDLLKRALPMVQEAADDRIRVATFIANRAFAAGGFQTAVEAVDLVDKWYTDDKREPDERQWGLWLVKVRSYEAMNYWPAEAKALLKRIESDAVHGGYLEIKKLRASVLESDADWAESLKIWEDLCTGLNVGTPDWFTARFRKAKCLYKLGRSKDADEFIGALEALHPDLGDRVVPGVRAKFLKLRELKGKYED